MPILQRVLPFLSWFRDYSLDTLRADFIAGLTVALVLVPQSMAYAQLAGLPAYYGLYAAFLPPMVANLFGSSRQLATGPVAVVSLMTAAALEPIATAGSKQYVAYAILLALMVGLFQLMLGVFRLGLVVNFLSHPVVNGFTNAAALIIATSQLGKIFGVQVDNSEHHYETVWLTVRAALRYTHLPTVGMAVLAFAIMIGLKRVNPRLPNVLAAVVVTTALAWATGFEKKTAVELDAIASPEVEAMVADFNAVVAQKNTLEEMRADTNKAFAQASLGEREFCVRCHETRDIEKFRQATLESAESEPQRTLALHQMAGLVDGHIGELKHHIGSYRSELRALLFERADRPDGASRFYLRGEVPEGSAAVSGPWRLKVGNSPLNLQELIFTSGGDVVATIPAGLPPFAVPQIDGSILPKLIPVAMVISLLGFMEAISIAKAMAAKTRQRIDPNQELIGQGLANLVGCMAQSYAVSGSFSRSAVNLQSGGRTGMSNVFSSVVVMVVLLFFSKTLYFLPQAVLAAIIMMAVFGLLNVSGFVHAWRTQKYDGFVSVVAFAGTLAFAPHLEWGLAMGVALSLGGYLYRTMRPKVADLAPHPDGSLRDAGRHKLLRCKYISVVSFDGPLNFASATYLEDEILGRVAERPQLRHLLIAGQGISEIDASGEETLRHIVERLRGAGYKVSFVGLKDQVLDVLRRSHLLDKIGEDQIYTTQAAAIAAIFPATHAAADEPDCPFRGVMPRITELSLHPDGSLRDAARHGLLRCDRIATLRFDDPLNFANTGYLEEEIFARIADRPDLRHIIFVAHGISDIDVAGARRLGQLVAKLREAGYEVSFSGLKEPVMDVLERSGVADLIGSGHIFATQIMAVAGVYSTAHSGSPERDCPLATLAPRLTELSLHPDGSLRDARRHSLDLCPHLAVLRFDGSMVFSDPRGIQEAFDRWVKARPEVQTIVFVAHALTALDVLDRSKLLQFVDRVRAAGFRVAFTSFRDHVFDAMASSGVIDEIGLDRVFPVDALALAGVWAEAHAGCTNEDKCPLRPMLPRVADLALAPDGSLRDARRHGLAMCPHIAALRFDGQLNFATIAYFEEQLRGRLAARPNLRHVLIAGHALSSIDALAAERLCEIVGGLRARDVGVSFSGLGDEVLETLQRTGGCGAVGPDNLFPTQVKAIEAIYATAHAGSSETHCPLLEVVPVAAG